jgi:hypothetical protein
MNAILFILIIAIIAFACVCLHLYARLDDANGRIDLLEVKADYSEKSEKTLRKSVDLQTKCIRDLNDIVKKTVENKEPTEPDTKALLGGWNVDEPELPKEEQPRPIDIFRMQKLISSLHCKNITPLYPWQQAELNQVLGPYGIREEWMK